MGLSRLTKKQISPKDSSVGDHLLYWNHSASYNDINILTCDSKNLLLELLKSSNLLWIETLYRQHCTYSTDLSNKILARIFLFNVILIETFYLLYLHYTYIILTDQTFYYFIIFWLFNIKYIITIVVIMVLFNLLLFWHESEPYHCHELCFVDCNTCTSFFLSLKLLEELSELFLFMNESSYGSTLISKDG